MVITGYCRKFLAPYGMDVAVPYFTIHFVIGSSYEDVQLGTTSLCDLSCRRFQIENFSDSRFNVDMRERWRNWHPPPLYAVRKKGRHVVLEVNEDRLVSSSDWMDYKNAGKKELFYGFLREGDPDFYIPNDLLLVFIQYLQDEAIKERDAEVRDYMKKNILNPTEKYIVDRRERTRKRAMLEMHGANCIGCAVSTLGSVGAIYAVYLLSEGEDRGAAIVILSCYGMSLILCFYCCCKAYCK